MVEIDWRGRCATAEARTDAAEAKSELLQRKASDWNAEADRYLMQRDELQVQLVETQAVVREVVDAIELSSVVSIGKARSWRDKLRALLPQKEKE